MKVLNILAILSLVFIITIGFDLYIFKLPLSNHFFNKLNTVLLNLSYSYIVGYVTYLFSAYFPQKSKTFQKREKIKMYVNTFFHRTNFSIANYKSTMEWTKSFIDKINDPHSYSLSDYLSTRNEIFQIRNNKRIECCEIIERELSDFKVLISGFEEYLTPNQDKALSTLNLLIDYRELKTNSDNIENHLIQEINTPKDKTTWEEYSKGEEELFLLEQEFLGRIDNIQQSLHLFWRNFQ